jgi:hypothetical protein
VTEQSTTAQHAYTRTHTGKGTVRNHTHFNGTNTEMVMDLDPAFQGIGNGTGIGIGTGTETGTRMGTR